MTRSSIIPVTDEEVARRMEFADAALAEAGHESTDTGTRAILAQAAREELDDDDVVATLRKHIQGGCRVSTPSVPGMITSSQVLLC